MCTIHQIMLSCLCSPAGLGSDIQTSHRHEQSVYMRKKAKSQECPTVKEVGVLNTVSCPLDGA